MKKNYKKLGVLVAIMIVTLSIASTGFAANTMKNLQAYYRDIKIFKNGAQVQFTNEPFIVDGTTYVPLRDMSEVLGKDVTWNGSIYRIDIKDRPGTDVTALTSQIYSQQMTISQLEAKIKTLEAKVKEEVESISLKDLAKQLLKDYDELDNFDVEEIKLKGDEDDITVEIYLDLDLDDVNDEDDWLDFEDDKYFEEDVIDFLQDIVDDILDVKEYEDADIEGFIEADISGDELISFYVNTKGKVILD